MLGNFNSGDSIYDVLSHKIDIFVNTGVGDYNEIIENIRSFQFSGDLTENEAETLILKLPDIEDVADDTISNSFNDVEYEEYDDSDLISDEELFDDEEEENAFLSVEYDEDTSPIEEVEFVEDKEESGISFDDDDDELLSYKTEDEDYYEDAKNDDESGFEMEDEEPMPDYDFSDLFKDEQDEEEESGFNGIF